MNGFERGIRRALLEVVNGLVTSTVSVAFVSSGLLPPFYVALFNLVNAIGTITLIFTMFYWGFTHLLGWLFALLLLLQSGLIGIFDLIVYLGFSIVALIIKAMRVTKLS
jgi:hypothetical protein